MKKVVFIILLGLLFSCKKNDLENISITDNYYDEYLDIQGLILIDSYLDNCNYYAVLTINPDINIFPENISHVQIIRDDIDWFPRINIALNDTVTFIDDNRDCKTHEYSFILRDKENHYAGIAAKDWK